MRGQRPKTGDRVVIDWGRWAGRTGTFVRYDLIHSGQLRLYPVVALDATPRAQARRVRVISVSPAPSAGGAK